MKILHVTHNFHPIKGGVEKNIEDICKRMIELGHTSDVCCSKIPNAPNEETYKGIRIYRVPTLNLKFYRISPKMAKISKKYDIVHVHGMGFLSDFFGLTKRIHGKPLVLSTHGGIFHTKRLSLLKKVYFHLWSRLPLRSFDKIVAVSLSDKQMFSKIRDSITFIPDSVDYSRFSSIIRKPEEGVFLFIGRITKNKRIDNLIRTFSLIQKEKPESTLVIVGSDWDNNVNEFKQLSKNLGCKNVIFTGKIDDAALNEYKARAKFFVSASDYEGFGISVLEAMSAGIPVIVNDIPAFRSFVKENDNGLFVDYSSPEQASSQIIDFMRNADLDKISSNAKKSAMQYDYRITGNSLEALYKELLEK